MTVLDVPVLINIVQSLIHDKTLLRQKLYYFKLLKSLNIKFYSKPVLLFLSSISLSSLILLIYNLQKLVQQLRKTRPLRAIQLKLGKYVGGGRKDRPKSGRTIYVPYKNDFIKLNIKSANYDKYEHDKLIFKSFLKDELKNNVNNRNLNFNFFKKIYMIWKLILIPNVFNKNTSYLILQISCLILRTWLSLLVTKLDGQIVKDLIDLKGKAFLRDLIYWFLFAFPASFTNSGIKYLNKKISLNFRTNLIRYCHDLYMDPKLVYYKLQFNSVNNDNYKLDYKYIDQYLTDDILKFCDTLTSLFSNIGKPFIDLIFFAIYLRDNLGTPGILGIFFNFFLTGYYLKLKSPNFNQLLKRKSYLEGIFYNYNLNLINNCEEISFYQGILFEKNKLKKIFNNLLNHINTEITQRVAYEFYESYILKYTWSALGYLFASIPIIFSNDLKTTSSETKNMRNFIVNKRLMLSMADAGSRLMYSIKDISKLSGCTDRIFTLLLNLHQVHDPQFQYGLVQSNHTLSNQIGFGSSIKLSSFTSRRDLLSYSSGMNNGINGTIQKGYNGLRFERFNVIVPSPKGSNAPKLIKDLTFKLDRNQNLLILGKNGIGKTSIIRILSELWPLYQGLISKPFDSEILYVSQRPYFLQDSNLRDQIIYPLTHLEMVQKGYTDDDLIQFLDDVGLSYLFDRFDRNLDYNPTLTDEGEIEEGEQEEDLDEAGSDKSKSNSDTNLSVSTTNDDGDLLMIRDESRNIRSLSLSSVDAPSLKRVKGTGSSATNKSGTTKRKSTGKGWFNILSGGERQKLIMARILFHNKPFIVLDEPTNAVSYDSEDLLFDLLTNAQKKGSFFTVITLSHRPILQKYHDYLLDLKDDGQWEFTKLTNYHTKSHELQSHRNPGAMEKDSDKYIDDEIARLTLQLKTNESLVLRKAELIGLLDNED